MDQVAIGYFSGCLKIIIINSWHLKQFIEKKKKKEPLFFPRSSYSNLRTYWEPVGKHVKGKEGTPCHPQWTYFKKGREWESSKMIELRRVGQARRNNSRCWEWQHRKRELTPLLKMEGSVCPVIGISVEGRSGVWEATEKYGLKTSEGSGSGILNEHRQLK